MRRQLLALCATLLLATATAPNLLADPATADTKATDKQIQSHAKSICRTIISASNVLDRTDTDPCVAHVTELMQGATLEAIQNAKACVKEAAKQEKEHQGTGDTKCKCPGMHYRDDSCLRSLKSAKISLDQQACREAYDPKFCSLCADIVVNVFDPKGRVSAQNTYLRCLKRLSIIEERRGATGLRDYRHCITKHGRDLTRDKYDECSKNMLGFDLP